MYHMRSCCHQWLEFALLSHCQSSLDFLLYTVKTIILSSCCVCDHTRGTRSSEMPILFFLFDLGVSLRSQGSGSSLYPLPSFIYSSSVCFLWWPMLCVEVFWPCLDERRRKAVSDWILDLQYDIVPVVLGPPSICLSSGKVHKT